MPRALEALLHGLEVFEAQLHGDDVDVTDGVDAVVRSIAETDDAGAARSAVFVVDAAGRALGTVSLDDLERVLAAR